MLASRAGRALIAFVGWQVAMLGTGWMMLDTAGALLFTGAHATDATWADLYSGIAIAVMLVWTGFVVWLAWKLGRWVLRGPTVAADRPSH